MMAVVVVVNLFLIYQVVVHKYNIILVYSIMFKLGKYDLSINLINPEPIEIEEIIKDDYFSLKLKNKNRYRNVLDINGVRKKILGKKLLKKILKDDSEFSTNEDGIDILDLLNIFHG
mgnify:CR=1 FL=1